MELVWGGKCLPSHVTHQISLIEPYVDFLQVQLEAIAAKYIMIVREHSGQDMFQTDDPRLSATACRQYSEERNSRSPSAESMDGPGTISKLCTPINHLVKMKWHIKQSLLTKNMIAFNFLIQRSTAKCYFNFLQD